MDEFDRATALEEAERDACVAAARNQPAMPAVGHCYNCNEPLPTGRLFCDTDCRDDFQKRTRKR
jgi:hypothetical protein